MNSNCLVGCLLVALCVHLLYVGDRTPEAGLCGYLTSFFPLTPLAIPAPFTPSLPSTSHLSVWKSVFLRTGSDLCRPC